MWIKTQDKTKIVNTDHVQFMTTSKSYGSKDNDGKPLCSAIIFQPVQGSVISMGLYHDIYEAEEVMKQVVEFLSSGDRNIFEMP